MRHFISFSLEKQIFDRKKTKNKENFLWCARFGAMQPQFASGTGKIVGAVRAFAG
jgi:hypothetical protein